MALSNIFNEPRREITESVVGIVAVLVALAPVGIGAWIGGPWIKGSDPTMPTALAYFLAIIGSAGGFAIICIFIGLTHDIGDDICNALQRRGVHLRPQRRP